jgi:hypothetical protein
MGSDEVLVRKLRDAEVVRPDVSDGDLVLTVVRAREEHERLPAAERPYNSPEERVRVFLDPYLTTKGRAWAVPLRSLDLPDE